MKYLTYNRAKGVHFASDSQPITLYLRRKGRWGVERASGPDDPQVLVLNPKTGRPIAKSLLLGQGVGVVTPPPPPPPPINWQSIPSYSLGSGDVYINGGYYQNANEGYDAVAFGAGYSSTGRLIIENAVIRGGGPAIGRYRNRFTLRNCVIITTPVQAAGRQARAILSEELLDAVIENCTFIGGMGMYFSGKDGQFLGDANAGQGVRVRNVRYLDLDGRRSDGNGGRVKSNWGSTHDNNSTRLSIGGQIGWDVANVVQCHEMPRCNILIEWVEQLSRLGRSRGEDSINMHGGSGGSSTRQAYIRDCLFDVMGGYDWNYQEGVSTAYNPSNQITAGATSPQDTSKTESSATGVLLADAYRSAYDDNASYTTAQRVVTMGTRPFISMQGGHHLTVDSCEIHNPGRHWSGVPFSWHQGYYQFSKYSNPNSTWGYQRFVNSRTYSGSTSAVMGPPGDILFNNGFADGNRIEPAITDQWGVIQAFRGRAAAAGVTLGSTLPLDGLGLGALPF